MTHLAIKIAKAIPHLYGVQPEIDVYMRDPIKVSANWYYEEIDKYYVMEQEYPATTPDDEIVRRFVKAIFDDFED